ncbi:MAG: S-layer protein [Candidatus Woesearchaeota archaeon]
MKFDRLFAGGLILRDPEQGLQGSGSVEFEIPEEAVKANIIVTGPGAVTTTTEYSSVTVNSVAGQSVIKLDTEVTDPASRNLILVGGPAVNRLTAQAMGLTYPTTGADSGIPEGAALIRLVENAFGGSNSALVVAGWDAEDTRAAASVLQNYRSYANSLDGRMEVQVSGTSVTAVGGDVATN